MGTRSSIAIKTDDGIKSIYCHWDGYIEHNGELLNKFYNTTDKVLELIALGDLSSLGSQIGQKHDFDAQSGPEPELDLTANWCMAYGRDRGESGTEYSVHDNIGEWVDSRTESWCEYFYLFDGSDWIVSKGLKDASGCFEFDYLDTKVKKVKQTATS